MTRTVLAAVGFDHLGAAPRFVAAVESGRIDRVLCDEATVAGGYMATVEGIPYHPIESARGHAVADASPLLTRYRAHTGHDLVAASPLAPDVAVIHVQQADAYGNARHLGSIWGDLLLAKASKAVIITADELVGEDEIRRNPRATTIPGFLVDAVVELPFGAHPCSSPGRYLPDERHLDAYLHGDFDAYVDGFVRLEEDAYLREVGADRLASLEQHFPW